VNYSVAQILRNSKILVGLKASTLVETIVAMTILAVVFMISISVILNSMWFFKPSLKFQALKMTKEVTFNAISEEDFTNSDFVYKKLHLFKEVEELNNGLINLKINVWYNDTILISKTNQIVLINEED
jgi:hypothetical protein